MGTGGKVRPTAWQGVLRGVLAALGLYLIGTALLALVIVKGGAPESVMFPVTAVLCVLAVLGGGLLAGPMLPPLPGAMAVAACFGGVLLAVGAACWQGVTWAGHGGILLACVLGGGLLSGMLAGSRRGRRRKLKRK